MAPRLAPLVDASFPLFAAVVVVSAGYSHGEAALHPAGLIVSVAAALALGARRRCPLQTVAATAALSIAALAVDRGIAPYTMLTTAAALFSVALFASRARQLWGGLSAAAVVVLAEALNENPMVVWETVLHLASLAAPILAAEALRTRRDHRTAVKERLVLVEVTREQEARRRVQDERLSVARDLHDIVAHTLTTVHVQASVARHLLDDRPEQARHALAVIEEASREGIAELRSILGVLRDPDHRAAATHTVAPGVDNVPDLVQIARNAGLHAELAITGSRPSWLPEAVSRAAYRIVQESLTNAARHTAAGARVDVELTFAPEGLAIAVENTITPPSQHANGHSHRRRTVTATAPTPRVGILGMTERAQALGGTLNAAASDTSFLVSARLPYAAR